MSIPQLRSDNIDEHDARPRLGGRLDTEESGGQDHKRNEQVVGTRGIHIFPSKTKCYTTHADTVCIQANTIRIEYIDRGVSHREGGWPADIHLDDPDQVSRFKRKAEKDKLYLQSVKTVAVVCKYICKNNFVKYFIIILMTRILTYYYVSLAYTVRSNKNQIRFIRI